MKKSLLLMLLAVLCFTTANAQETKTTDNSTSERVFDVVEQMPSFPGGQGRLMQFLSENLKYPQDAERQKIEGRILVSFIVEADGSISNAKIIRGIYPSLDAEAVRVVMSMPRWNPGKQNGKAVRVKYSVPISFKL